MWENSKELQFQVPPQLRAGGVYSIRVSFNEGYSYSSPLLLPLVVHLPIEISEVSPGIGSSQGGSRLSLGLCFFTSANAASGIISNVNLRGTVKYSTNQCSSQPQILDTSFSDHGDIRVRFSALSPCLGRDQIHEIGLGDSDSAVHIVGTVRGTLDENGIIRYFKLPFCSFRYIY